MGGSDWIPLAGDWNGDGTDTIALYDPATARFYLHNSNTTGIGEITFYYGVPGAGWIPVVGDWTGQTNSATGLPMDTIGLYDPKTCTWMLRNSLTTGVADITFSYGAAGQGWKPVAGDWPAAERPPWPLRPGYGGFLPAHSNITGTAEIVFPLWRSQPALYSRCRRLDRSNQRRHRSPD